MNDPTANFEQVLVLRLDKKLRETLILFCYDFCNIWAG